MTQPRGNTEAIQLPTVGLKLKSQSSLQSEMCGRTGEVHASPLPWANAPRHAVSKMAISLNYGRDKIVIQHILLTRKCRHKLRQLLLKPWRHISNLSLFSVTLLKHARHMRYDRRDCRITQNDNKGVKSTQPVSYQRGCLVHVIKKGKNSSIK